MALNPIIQLVKACLQALYFVPLAGKEAGGVPSTGDQGERVQRGSREDQSSARGSRRDCCSGVVSPWRDWCYSCCPGRAPDLSECMWHSGSTLPKNAVWFGRAVNSCDHHELYLINTQKTCKMIHLSQVLIIPMLPMSWNQNGLGQK